MAKNIPWDQSYSKTGAGKAQRRARFGLSPSCEDFGFGGEESVVMADIKGFWANSEEKWRAQRRQWGKRHSKFYSRAALDLGSPPRTSPTAVV
nr:hypothetical protein Iba_chr07dCG6310 [Ipomoea batatas]